VAHQQPFTVGASIFVAWLIAFATLPTGDSGGQVIFETEEGVIVKKTGLAWQAETSEREMYNEQI
jgi:hypothetical protein